MEKKGDINDLKLLVAVLGPKYKHEMKDVIKQFEERKTHTKREALKTITMLASRGKQSNIKALERLERHKVNGSIVPESHKLIR